MFGSILNIIGQEGIDCNSGNDDIRQIVHLHIIHFAAS